MQAHEKLTLNLDVVWLGLISSDNNYNNNSLIKTQKCERQYILQSQEYYDLTFVCSLRCKLMVILRGRPDDVLVSDFKDK